MGVFARFVVLAGLFAMAAAAHSQTQQPQKSPAKKSNELKLPARTYYDAYEPLQRARLKRESCMRDEDSIGAYCVKKCLPSYELKSEMRPMRCQGTKPLAPGVLPGPVRSDIGVQKMPSQPDAPPRSKPGA